MLPLACVCVPVLGVLVAGLLAERRYLADLRWMRRTVTPLPNPVAAPRPPVDGASARPAA
jgi:hypothetical protein